MTDKIIYVCGEFSSNRLEDINSKCLILGNLASLYSVRTHPVVDCIDTSFDKAELYSTITRCHVFVFIFSKETVNDTFYLNQFGIAKAYGVPVIGVREPSYFMPNPLPEQFYFTEIVDYTGVIRDGQSNRGVQASKKQFLLADALVQDFKTAMVYAPEFHKSCFQRLLHKVSQAFNRSENEKKFYLAVKDQPKVSITPFKESVNAAQEKVAQNKIPKCPKCGFSLNKQLSKTPTLQRASSTGSLLRRGDAFEGESVQQKQIQGKLKPTLQPTTIVIPAPPYTGKNHSDYKIRSLAQNNAASRQQPQKVIEPFKGKLQSRSTTLHKDDIDKKDNDNIMKEESKKDAEKTEQDNNKNKTLRKQSRVGIGSWTDKFRIKLRRQSSLPVIPTTYLVTSPAGDKQLSFVKYPPESFLLSPRQSLLPIFSEDEEQETIHISRAPSPDGSNWSEKEKEKDKET